MNKDLRCEDEIWFAAYGDSDKGAGFRCEMHRLHLGAHHSQGVDKDGVPYVIYWGEPTMPETPNITEALNYAKTYCHRAEGRIQE